MTGQRRCVVVASLVAAIAGAAPAHADTTTATPALTVVGQAEGPQKLPVAKTAHGQRLSAALPVVVRNDSDTEGVLEPVLAQQQGGADVKVEPLDASVPANGIVAITLRFTATGSAPSIDSTVLLRLKDEPAVKPAVFQVTGTPAPDATFAQKTTKFTVTRIFGQVPVIFGKTGLLHGKADVPLHDAAPLKASDPSAQALLTADNGRTARVVLHEATRKPGGNYVALADVTDVTHTGEYAGSLPFDPSDPKASATEVTIQIQDFILFPLLVVFLGAAIGGYGRKRFEQWRERRLLEARLDEKLKAYDKAREGDASDEPNLDDRVGCTKDGSCVRRDSPEGASLEVNVLRAEIRAADTVDKLAAATTATDALIADIDRYVALDGALEQLRAARTALPSLDDLADDRAELPLTDARLMRVDTDVLCRGLTSLDDADVVTAFTERVQRQTAVAAAFARAWQARDLLAPERPPEGSPGAAALVADDPRAIYAAAKREPDRSKRDATTLVHRLEAATGELRWYAEHPVQAGTPDPELAAARHLGMEHLDIVGNLDVSSYSWRRGLSAPLGRVAEVLHLVEPRHPTPEQTRARVRHWDFRVFLLAATVTALAYVLPLYVGKAWGSWDDYLTAFVAGAAGTVLIPWELLPMFRSDRKAAKAPAAEAAA